MNLEENRYGIPAVLILPNGEMYGFEHYSEAVEFKKKFTENNTKQTQPITYKPTAPTNKCIADCGDPKCPCRVNPVDKFNPWHIYETNDRTFKFPLEVTSVTY